MQSDPIAVGSDHAGYQLKDFVKSQLKELKIPYEDMGAMLLDPGDDYPVFAAKVAHAVSGGSFKRGIAVCGSGIGASITANRFPKVRAALCVTPEMARLSRLHNDANVLILGERIVSRLQAAEILRVWLETAFEGGRHQRRVELIDNVARNNDGAC